MNTKLRTILLNNKLYIDIYKEYYYFTIPKYAMELKLYKKDVLEFLKNPINNFKYRNSYGNCMNSCDRNIIIKFLMEQKGLKKYKTISRCILYSKKNKLRDNLNLFTTNELYKYFKK